jgi:hypothetical protein
VQGPFGLVHVVRDADLRDVPDISDELRAVKADLDATGTGRMLRRFGPAAARVPGLFPAMYAVMSRSKRVHLFHRHRAGDRGRACSPAVPDFAIAPPTLASLVVVVGGLSRRPIAVDDQIVIHDVLDLTITIDHNVVDGAPGPPASVPNCGTSWKAPQPSRRNTLPTHRELPARTGGLGPPQRIPPQHMAAVLHAGKSHGGDVPHLAVAQRGRPDHRDGWFQ